MKHRLHALLTVFVLLTLLLILVPDGARLSAAPLPGRFLDAQSTTGPTPPSGVDVQGALAPSPDAVVISNVPAYIWHHGCGPTAAGMVIGYWDGQGFEALVPGDASTQTAAANAMIASEGPASNYTDYCEPLDYSGTHPSPLPDRSELPTGDEHPDNCVADYMKTSQSYHYNYYGWSWFSHVGQALESYVNLVGQGLYQATTSNLYMYSGLDWSSLRAEIDGGHPMVFLVDTDGNGSTDHFVTVIGYDTVGAVPKYACLNTWDGDIHWFDFAQIAPGQPWGIFGAVTFRIESLVTNRIYLSFTARGN